MRIFFNAETVDAEFRREVVLRARNLNFSYREKICHFSRFVRNKRFKPIKRLPIADSANIFLVDRYSKKSAVLYKNFIEIAVNYFTEACLTDFTKSVNIISNDNEPRIAGIMYISSYLTAPNQFPKTGEPSQAPIQPKITLEMNELKPGLT